jgi:hypothetical protein
MDMIQARRQVVDFADVYVRSVEQFMRSYQAAQPERGLESVEAVEHRRGRDEKKPQIPRG